MNETKDVKAVIFDMDGVIFDSERITRIMWDKAGKEFNISDAVQTCNEVTGASYTDAIQYIQKKYGPTFPAAEFRDRCSKLFHEYADNEGLPFMPYAQETLNYIKSKGYHVALASSTRHNTVEKELKQAGIYDIFETITCGDQVAHSKPDPEIYLTAAKSIGVNPDECVAIEDSPNGIRSAYSAGMRCIMVVDQIQPTEEIKQKLYKLCDNLQEVQQYL